MTLRAIASVTGFPVAYFARRRSDADVSGYFRSLRSTPARERRRSLAHAHLVHDFVQTLDKYVEFPDVDVPRQPATSRSRAEIEELAVSVRRQWGMGLAPVDNVVRRLERHGVIATRFKLGSAAGLVDGGCE